MDPCITLISSLIGNGIGELVIRNPGIIGLDAKDLQTMPYVSALSSGISGGFNAAFGGATWGQSIAKSFLTAGLTLGEAKIEAVIIKSNPNISPIMAAYLADAGTAVIEGVATSFYSPDNRTIVDQNHNSTSTSFTPLSGINGVFEKIG